MTGFLGRISETRENRVKATKAQMDEVRELLPNPDDGRIAIPECMSADDGDWDWEAFAVMTYVMGKAEEQDYTLDQAREDSGLHTVRLLAPELSFFYGRTGDKKKVEEHWVRVFEIIDSFDKCPNCGGTRVPSWTYCGWCAERLLEIEEPVEPPGNPTQSETSSDT